MSRRRDALAGAIAGLVIGLSQAWWWGNVYLALFCLLGGIALFLTVWVATASNHPESLADGHGRR